jgi:hypothetical protein
MLQTPDTIESCMIPVVPLPLDLIDPTLDVSEPCAEDFAITQVIRTLARAFLSAVVLRSAFVDSLAACFPLARELRVAYTQQLCATRGVRRRHGHQLSDGELMAFPQHERLFRWTPFVCIEAGLDSTEQVHQALGFTAIFRSKTHELSLRSQNVGPAEILAK